MWGEILPMGETEGDKLDLRASIATIDALASHATEASSRRTPSANGGIRPAGFVFAHSDNSLFRPLTQRYN